MKAVVFLGPTLGSVEARAILAGDCDVKPPARRGDLYRAAAGGADLIGLIDGYFRSVPAVLHKEILWAIDRGAAVLGASSMGALRATELSHYGMIGIGKIFDDYMSGRLWSDDEVAIEHGPEELGFVPTSDALVDIRATLAHAVEANRIPQALADALVASAKAKFYPDRKLATLLAAGSPPVPPEIRAWVVDHRIEQKAEDARELLKEMSRIMSDGVLPPRPAFELAHTAQFSDFRAAMDNPLIRDLGYGG